MIYEDFNWAAFTLLWGFTAFALWFVPPMMGMDGMGFVNNLVMTICLAVVTYFIVGQMSSN